jgi:hypothetical protein
MGRAEKNGMQEGSGLHSRRGRYRRSVLALNTCHMVQFGAPIVPRPVPKKRNSKLKR